MNKLILDTADNKQIKISLEIGNKTYEQVIQDSRSSTILPHILRLLEKNNIDLKDLTAIEVNPGPGSFTGVRVGISIANALSAALNIPINGKNSKLVEPKYK